jgi:dihydrofolate reductase
MNVTLDGFMAGPNCELDWHFKSWNEEMAMCAAQQLSKADTILLGRVTYRAMAKYWPAQSVNLLQAREDLAFADMMNNHFKIVFSKTLEKAEWNNTLLVKDNITAATARLKQKPGKDMIIYGSGKVASALIRSGLVDEYHMWMHPVFIGRGKPLFSELDANVNMKLFRTEAFSSGVVLLYYRSAG